MKQFIAIWMVALIGIGSAQACMKKQSALCLAQADEDLVILVMDTMQSLLPDAEIKIGKTVQRTSWDGRVILTPEQWNKAKNITVKCEGFEAVTVKKSAFSNPMIISMKPKKIDSKKRKEESVMAGGGKVMFRSKSGEALEAAMPLMMTAAAAEYDAAEAIMPMMKGGAVNNAVAGMLTAGEVNDFAKWHLWNTYLQLASKHQVTWRLTPAHRYTVQVMNRHGYPIAARAVSLTDKNGNTLFQAVTDNTGKAELWLDITAKNSPNKDLQIRLDDQIQTAKEWSEGMNTFMLDEECENRDGVDVMFVFDATGSMGDELRYLQAEMKDVIARASEATGGMDIRTGAVVYRDHNDDYVTRISRLTSDIATTQAFIDKQEAYGGGDYPEAVPEALMAALNSGGWDSDARTRIAFLILDAPCHEDSATIALMHDQILNAAALGVRVVPVVCSGLGESGEFLLRAIALATNGTSFFLTDDSGIGNEHLKPTTDSLVVEHLNDMLVRTIAEFSYMPNCAGHWTKETEENEKDNFVPNPFEIKDLSEQEIKEKDSPTTLYLLDISGKLITVYQGRLEEASDAQLSRLHLPMLSTGVYFVKAFYNGAWHTKKILVH